ncbi:MAG: T9SS type A sorting domain-containing protein, partial [Ignavibacteria bacterium]
VDSFAASGAGTGFLRDLAYAKGKIWGSPLSGIVYGINPVTGVCEKTITMSGASSIRGLAWDPVRNGFWCGTANFSGPVKCYDTNGVFITGAQFAPASIYGIAYDDDPAGPFIWISTDQTPTSTTGVAILKYNATTLAMIGTPINLTIPHIIPSTSGYVSSGSCELTTSLITGKRTLVGLAQGGVDRVYVVDLGNLTTITPISGEIPKDYTLSQNYPNPFNPSTSIDFSLPKAGYISLKVYNSMGKEVKTLTDGNFNAGNYAIGFDATGLSSGIYFYKLQTEGFTATKKMLLVK